MAIYKGREVQLLGRLDGVPESPLYRVQDQNQQIEHVRLKDMQLTDDEKKDLQKTHGLSIADVPTISDKDLQELRDGQNRDKIEDRQKKDHKNKDVPVSTVKVNADEVARNVK